MNDGREMNLATLQTPCLLVDESKMTRNIERLTSRLRKLGVTFRPHLKTAKSVDIARRMMPTPGGPATVSTLREAEEFADAGVADILYAVGIAPNKLDRVLALRRSGVDLAVILDNADQARAVAAASRTAGQRIPALIEIDSDGRRAGVRPDDHDRLIQIAHALQDGAELRGVMTHAGGSYDGGGEAAIEQAAENERRAVVTAAGRLRDQGFSAQVVSVGSTPTAFFARDLTGVTEVRAGVFVFMDLVMVGIGVCALEDIALSTLATVIGHQRERGWILVDAGWTAVSRDRGTASQAVDQGYGLVCDVAGEPYDDLIMIQVTQEHGVLAIRDGSNASLPPLEVGSLVRILPNHACATSTQHERYHILGAEGRVKGIWPRFSGW